MRTVEVSEAVLIEQVLEVALVEAKVQNCSRVLYPAAVSSFTFN